MKQQVRIIGGKLKGKKISFPAIDGLRPTPDRVRETLFNWLMNSIAGTRCLDAFAGSGALGFEAYSRGAREVVFIEESLIAFKNLQQIARDFNAQIKGDNQPALGVLHADANCYLKTHPEPFDLIFADPPFSTMNYLQLIDLIHTSNALKSGGLLYLESPSQLTLDPQLWTVLKSNRAGSVYYSLYEKQPAG